jgi:hypothetical protein
MTLAKRRIKLFIFFIIFIVAAPLMVLYARGDILGTGWTFLPTGGIYVNAAPTGSNIFLNNKLKDSTSFFSKDIVLKSLRSGTYDVRVEKDGYNTWSKKIKVSNNLVSDANVFMLPQKVELKEITKYLASSTVKNSEYTDLALEFAKKATTTKSISTSTVDFKSNLGTKLSPIMSGKIGLWKEGTNLYSAWFGTDDRAPRYFCDTENCSKPVLVEDLTGLPHRFDFLPDYSGVAVVALNEKVFAIQIENNSQKIEQEIYKGKAPDFRIIDGNLYIKDGSYLAEVIL